MNKPKSRLFLILMLVLALMLLLVACDEKDDDQDDTPATSRPTAAATQDATSEPAAIETTEATAPTAEPAAVETVEAAAPTEEPQAVATEPVEVAAATDEPVAAETVEPAPATEEPAAVETVEAAAPTEEPAPAETQESTEPVAAELPTIAEVIAGNRIFSTLATAVEMAELAEALGGTDEFTVFAPINRAFENVPADQMSAAMADPALLTSVLQYHVVPGLYLLSDLEDGMTLETLAGEQLTVTVNENNNVLINGARIRISNMKAANGIVHAIDGVLVPAGAAPEASATSEPEAAATAEPETEATAEPQPAATEEPVSAATAEPVAETTPEAETAVEPTAEVSETGVPASHIMEVAAGDLGSEDNPIVLMFIPSERAEEVQAGGEQLAALLSEKTGLAFEVTVSTDYSAAIEALCGGEAEMAALATFSYVAASERGCAIVGVVSSRFGSTFYQAQIITQTGSDIESYADLAGKTFCRPDAFSTSGWIIPSIAMQANGLNPDEDLEVLDVGGHDAVVQAVYNGECDAGATFVDARDQIAHEVADVYDKVEVLELSAPIPNDTISFSTEVPEDIRANIVSALVEISEDAALGEVLADVYSWEALVPAEDAFFDDFREQLDAAGIDIEEFNQ